MANLLGNEASPYLLQHKDNPVHWHPWNDKALTRAQTENKPILLSIGYAACHWCHVMAHESFESPEIAELMNELFINIKVDREERPDLDSIYQTALAVMGEQGGWPLTMFLTPDARPFWGGTYFPPTSRWGRPGFPEVLRTLSETYKNDPEKVTKNVAALGSALEEFSKPDAVSWSGIHSTDQIDGIAEAALQIVDLDHGGNRGAPKFPQPAFFNLLWRAYRRTRRDDYSHAVTTTLDNICQGGIYDHLGGGFARYSTDDRWLAPHFEKMLYDNAQLLELLALVWRETASPLYWSRAEETVAWLKREMLLDDGGFAGSLDADSEGEEGTFYVWTDEAIDELLGPDSEHFKTAYDVTPGGNWEGKTILNRLNELSLRDDEGEARLTALRQTLWQAREKRPRPGLDDKVLADWNGLMIAGLTTAGAILDKPAWITMATKCFGFICSQMTHEDRLCHSWRNGTALQRDVLDDYAQMSRAAIALFQVTADKKYLAQAEAWVTVADEQFWSEDGGGYYLSPADADDLIIRTRTAFDNATPAGNGTMVEVLAKLYHLTGNEDYRGRAETIARAFTASANEQLINLPSLLNGIELLAGATQVIVVGPKDHPNVDLMRKSALAAANPNLVLNVLTPGKTPPDNHPAAGKTPVDNLPTAYVCVGPTCGLPLTDVDALKEALAGR